MNTCKNCNHYVPNRLKAGDCQMVNTDYWDKVGQDKKITYSEADHGGAFYVGENFGCIHFEEKEK